MFDLIDLRKIFDLGDFITGDKILKLVERNSRSIYRKRDFLFQDGVWRNKDVHRCTRQNTNGLSVFLGHSDFDFGRLDYLRLKLLGARSIFASNMNFSSEAKDIDFLPLGLCNYTSESLNHLIRGDQTLIGKVLQKPNMRNFNKYITVSNFSIETYPSVRSKLHKLVSRLDYIQSASPNMSSLGRFEFLENIFHANMVVVPRGNGRDTHRFWEALYLGAVPIVVEKDLPGNIFKTGHLPVVLLKNWDQLSDRDLIYRLYEKVLSEKHDVRRVSMRHFTDYLITHINA
jgi:hypothetical protein